MKTITASYEAALRRYEQAHKVWMTTSVFTEAGYQAKKNLDVARTEYLQAREAYEEQQVKANEPVYVDPDGNPHYSNPNASVKPVFEKGRWS